AQKPVIPASEALMKARMQLQSGSSVNALQILDQARREHPKDAALADAAGDLSLKAGNIEVAIGHFAAACENAPEWIDYAVNHAIALQRLDRHDEALTLLDRHEEQGRTVAKYARVRAMSERAIGNLAAAANWYDAAIAGSPSNSKGLHGRARVALERGEPDALQRFDRALAINPGDAELWLGKAQALDVLGDVQGARTIAQQIATQAPGFMAGQSFLAQLRLAAGERDFSSHYEQAAAKHPQDPNIPAEHCETLAGLDYAAEAAEVAAQARKRFPEVSHFALLEAVNAGAAGDWDRAERIFETLKDSRPVRFVQEARHRIRVGDTDRAETVLAHVIAAEPTNIAAWALRGIGWRLSGDPRAEWLHEQSGLVQLQPLNGASDLVDRSIEFLRELHAGSAMPLGQSLRGGTQTRAILFHRPEPVLEELHKAILATLEAYRAALAPSDISHPLLMHRDTPWRLQGSWSVRLTGGGDYHTAHIHPQGIVSSALYLIVPKEADGEDQHGWLEVGRPPPDLGLDLPPLRTIKPQPGYLALFPSTLYHGTTPFPAAERMTVAFDVVTKAGK
ncbi:MAG: tetratricopeptide repeat protein, partial [Pseudomonadota bacterium]